VKLRSRATVLKARRSFRSGRGITESHSQAHADITI
jgi:hypothetical protein